MKETITLKKLFAPAVGYLFTTRERADITGPALRRSKVRKRRIVIFATLFVILILSPVGLNQYYNYLLEPRSNVESPQIFIIKQGEPVTTISQNLKEAKLIKSPLAFRLLVAQMGIAKNIQAGDFRFSPHLSSRQIAQELTHGAVDVWITLPEGLRIEEQAQKIEEKLKIPSNDKYAFDKKEYIKIAEEGFMFPDTYLIPKDATASDIAAKLKNTFDLKTKNLFADKTKSQLSQKETIILASLIEREAKTDEEKPIIAGIITNRLKSNIALQIDATVAYAKGYDTSQNSWWTPVSTEDYRTVKSPFNTYLAPGLPPAPIANPGLMSIKAAINSQDTDYLYYLHDTNGKIHYAKTIEQHNQNIKDFLF